MIGTKLNVVQVAEVRLAATDISGNPLPTNGCSRSSVVIENRIARHSDSLPSAGRGRIVELTGHSLPLPNPPRRGEGTRTNDRDEIDDGVDWDACTDEDSSRGCSVVQQPSQLLARCQTIIRCEDFFTNRDSPHLVLSRRGLRRGNCGHAKAVTAPVSRSGDGTRSGNATGKKWLSTTH